MQILLVLIPTQYEANQALIQRQIADSGRCCFRCATDRSIQAAQPRRLRTWFEHLRFRYQLKLPQSLRSKQLLMLTASTLPKQSTLSRARSMVCEEYCIVYGNNANYQECGPACFIQISTPLNTARASTPKPRAYLVSVCMQRLVSKPRHQLP